MRFRCACTSSGQVDLDHIAELLARPRSEVAAELAGLVYLDPATGRWETADAYLSGKVREKLVRAEEAAASDPRFEPNVEALRAAQPVDLKPSEITARLGAPWIPVDVVETFAQEVIGVATRVRHISEIGHWSVDTSAFAGVADCRTTWGTSRRHAGELLDDALNAHIPQIWDVWTEDGHERRELNAEETEAAKEKLAAIKSRVPELGVDRSLAGRAPRRDLQYPVQQPGTPALRRFAPPASRRERRS